MSIKEKFKAWRIRAKEERKQKKFALAEIKKRRRVAYFQAKGKEEEAYAKTKAKLEGERKISKAKAYYKRPTIRESLMTSYGSLPARRKAIKKKIKSKRIKVKPISKGFKTFTSQDYAKRLNDVFQ